ncbi:MAG: hypothetical protein E6G36_10305 [Actinobacteria bacterium]|nr:MAG: hypothetical protein E6G36_10305 [Actinomycetota bacterium]
MSSDDPRTVAALWQRAVTAGRTVPAYLVDGRDSWREVSWAEAGSRVDELAHGLLDLGITRGDRVAILGSTRIEWALLDFALCSLGAVVVPIYPTSSEKECAYILADAEVRAIAVEDDAQRDKIEQLPNLEHVVGFDDLDDLAERGRTHRYRFPNAVAEAASLVREDDVLTCIYTSGTTGPPKGCVLTNRNFVAMTDMIGGVDLMRPGDRVVLFLPLAHGFGRLVHFAAARTGFTPVPSSATWVARSSRCGRTSSLPFRASTRRFTRPCARSWRRRRESSGASCSGRSPSGHARAGFGRSSEACRRCSRCRNGLRTGSSSRR